MKRPRENDDHHAAGHPNTTLDDQIPEVVLDSLDREADGPSNDGDNDSDPVLELKHDIFLSHSGKQKDFTELLCRELERWGYNPFLDIREDSLPKGKKFPELIFRAASQCRVAVLILSEEFFTNTKWPMLELAAFVDVQKRGSGKSSPVVDILPVYLGVTRAECGKDANIERWQKRWEEMEELEVAKKKSEMGSVERAQLEAEIESGREKGESRVQKWRDALKVLGPSNGIEYEQSSRQAGLMDRIVSAVRGLLPPPNMASDANIHAKRRISETIIGMISRIRQPSSGARVVGVYGVGGMGKTTFCKELCCVLYKKFGGKVYHAELGKVAQTELQREVVRKLTNVNHEALSLVDESKVIDLLLKGMAREKVFLALDNVWPESKEEAMVYVKEALYGKGSIVVVTARSIDILLSLRIKGRDCFEMPELEEDDARQLFLHHAAPDFVSPSKDDERMIQYCINQCRFSKGRDKGVHFLPLALKVFGLQMHNIRGNPKQWVESLSEDIKFNHDRRREHPIFGILGKGYDVLQEDDKLLFMDAILCNPNWKNDHWPSRDSGVSFYEWLSIVHSLPELSIMNRLQGLKARALLEDIGDGVHGVNVHDLYREFAKFEANRGDLNARHVVWHDKNGVFPSDLSKSPPGNCWSNLERVGVEYYPGIVGWDGSLGGIKWQHFANVVVLVLRIGDDQVLDLGGSRCLRSLTLRTRGGTLIGLGELRNLGWLDLHKINCSTTCFQEIGALTELQMLRVNTMCSGWNMMKNECRLGISPALELPNVDKCINLRELIVRCRCLKVLPDLAARMTFLKQVEFECWSATEGLRGLGSQLSALQFLRLFHCNSLCNRLPRLGEVVSLQVLHVDGLRELEVFPDIRMLTRLWELSIVDCPELVQLPALGELMALKKLQLWGLPKVRELPDMRLLTELRLVELRYVRKLLENPRLLDGLPPQLPYFQFEDGCGGDLTAELDKYGGYHFLDLSERHNISVSDIKQIDPDFRGWMVWDRVSGGVY